MTSLPFEILEMENLYIRKKKSICFMGMCASISITFFTHRNQFCKPPKRKQLLVSNRKGNVHTAQVTLADVHSALYFYAN